MKIEDSCADGDESLSSILYPLSSAGGRLYRTGDLVRYRADGAIEFLGRIDNQVKIRGFRIEPGEIETVLAEHPLVRETVVVAREFGPGDTRLVAYFVPTTDKIEDGGWRMEDSHPDASKMLSSILHSPSSEKTGLKIADSGADADHERSSILDPRSSIQGELRDFLKNRLPDYMIPAAFVSLEVLPLTPNGKIDRGALPVPHPSQLRGAATYAAPERAVEQVLCTIWSEVLEVERVGIHDDFFELGGHSLKATQLTSRINDVFPIDLPLRRVFELPTVAQLAEAIDDALFQAIEALPEDEAQRWLALENQAYDHSPARGL